MQEQPKIEYVRHLYIYGSEVQAPKKQEVTPPVLPKPKHRHVRKVYVNPAAVLGMAAALVLLGMMAVGAFRLQHSWNLHNEAAAALTEIQREHAALDHAFHTGFDPEEVRTRAEELGMVDKEEAGVMTIRVTIPAGTPENTLLDDLKWFLKGLFAEE